MFAITEDSFRYPWRRIAKAAGVKKFHSFRRTSAKDKRPADIPASVIMEESGWKTEAMFRRYAITTRTDRMRSQQKLEEFQEGRTKAAQLEAAAKSGTEQVQ